MTRYDLQINKLNNDIDIKLSVNNLIQLLKLIPVITVEDIEVDSKLQIGVLRNKSDLKNITISQLKSMIISDLYFTEIK